MKKYVLVGVGARSEMYQNVFLDGNFPQVKLAAICDTNQGRLKVAADRLLAKIPDLKSYSHEQFDKMITNHKPDCVIVCTVDSTHDEYIRRSMELGCDLITEKPMTTDEKRCQRIIDTCKSTGKSVRVTFNYRYAPPRSQVKELLDSGLIGKVLSVSFQWLLDTNHGADYFRRWHRNKKNSGGLLVHKATHHFDLVNWWLATVPETVYANGKRVFYNTAQAKRYGLENHGQRCLECPVSNRCNFYLDIKRVGELKQLYLDNETYDGYFRDCCVFEDGDSDIEDVANVIVEYKNGALLSYSLNAFMPWEGYRVEFNGTKGRLEHCCQEASYISGDGSIQGALKPEQTAIRIYPHFQTPYSVEVRQSQGDHGGGDIAMVDDLFGPLRPDPLRRAADYKQGAWSILTGIAANKSITTGKVIRIEKLVTGLPADVFSQTIDENEKIPYVPCAKRLADI